MAAARCGLMAPCSASSAICWPCAIILRQIWSSAPTCTHRPTRRGAAAVCAVATFCAVSGGLCAVSGASGPRPDPGTMNRGGNDAKERLACGKCACRLARLLDGNSRQCSERGIEELRFEQAVVLAIRRRTGSWAMRPMRKRAWRHRLARPSQRHWPNCRTI